MKKKRTGYSVFEDGEYYRGEHGEVRRKDPKIHLSKKRKRYLRKLAKEKVFKGGN